MRLSIRIAFCAALAAAALPASGQTLRVAVSSPVTSIDPHYHNLAPNISLSSQIFGRLVETDAHAHPVPRLATSWKLIAPDTWEFKLRYMAQFFIVSRKAGEGMATEDYNSGKAAIGTGPFRFVSYKPGDRVELERHDGYGGDKPTWQHVDHRFIANDASRTAALLAGDVDFIHFVPTEDLQKLRKEPKVKLWEQLGLRPIFLGLDQSRDGPGPFVFGPNGEKLDRNPPYDPAQAKKLLAEAGYPKGFRIALHGPNDRYVNDARIVQAIGQMWTRIGVRTEVDPLPWTSFVGQANKQAFSAFLFGWGSGTAEASDPLIAQNATFDPAKGRGAANRGRYSNPALDRLIDQALATADDAAREKLQQQAQRVAFDDVAIIPLHIQKNIWATRAGLTYVPTVGENLRLTDVRPAK